jgi:peptide/nickel transport system substrate-binding protein
MRRFASWVGCLLSACLVAAGCSSSPESAGQPEFAENGTFTMLTAVDPGSFDPYRSLQAVAVQLAYDSLVNLQSDGTFASGLAEKWTADARSASFTLRTGVTCSDGAPLTASQVAEAINFVGDPAQESVYYGIYTPTAAFSAKGDDASGTVSVTMRDEPFGFLLQTIGLLPIVCAKGLRNPDSLKAASDGTGPFVLSEVAPGQSLTFTVRKDYAWGPSGASTSAPGTPAKVVVKVIPNSTTAANLLLNGDLNFAQIDGPDQARLDGQGLQKVEASTNQTRLWINHRPGRPTADKRVRQALFHAVDLRELAKVNSGGTGRVGTGLAAGKPPVCPGGDVTADLPGHDAAAAQKLLDEAGWVRGADGTRRKDGKPLTIDLYFIAALEFSKATAELLAQRWREIGVQPRIHAGGQTSGVKVLYETGNWDIYMGKSTGFLPSASVRALSGPIPPAGINFSGVNNPAYNALAAKAAALTVPDACEQWKAAEKALLREVDIVPAAEKPQYWYLKDAQAQTAGYQWPVPTSIRMTR